MVVLLTAVGYIALTQELLPRDSLVVIPSARVQLLVGGGSGADVGFVVRH